VNRKPDLIVANLNPLVAAFKTATTTIPIAAIVGDPVGYGLVASLARPGGNLTGVSTDAGIEIYAKRLQVLKETLPATSTVAYLVLPPEWNGKVGRTMRDAGAALGVAVTGLMPEEVTPAQLTKAFAAAVEQKIDGFIVSSSGDFLAHRQLIAELAERTRLSAVYPYRDYVLAGGLMAYAPELGDLARHLAEVVHQILQGAKPGDIPIYQATRFELVINLKTAKALGLSVPQSLLPRADEVIE
jgi:putative ABC transport system substrate-binding protein